MNNCSTCRVESLIIFSCSAIGIDPGESSFNNPSFRKYFEEV